MASYNGAGKSSRLKVAHLPNKPPPRLRLGGFLPSENMPAGEYTVHCEGASKKPWAQGWRVELKHRVLEGEHAGVSLNQWIPIDASGVISPRSRYALQCEIALGRPLEPEDDLNDPASIFSGVIFSAFVGFRKTDKPRGGKNTDPENQMRKKDHDDGLRVHELLTRAEL